MSLFKIACCFLAIAPLFAQKTVVFQENGFPTIESAPVPRAVLDETLRPGYLGLDELGRPRALEGVDLLVLPYGSAFPLEAWSAIREFSASGGNILVVGGRPFQAAVRREGASFRVTPGAAWARQFGISHTYEAPQKDFASTAREFDFDFLPEAPIRARRVFVNGVRGAYRAMVFLRNAQGRNVAAPLTRMDFADRGARCVFLSFEAEPGYWESEAGKLLLSSAAKYARQGAAHFWIEVHNATIVPGEAPQVVAHIRRERRPLAGTVRVELQRDGRVMDAKEVRVEGQSARENLIFSRDLAPGLYTIRGSYSGAAGVEEVYHTGVWSRDEKTLRRGARLETAGDYFRAAGKPMLLFGANYFTTDVEPTNFIIGGNAAGNAWRWDLDFAEMARHNVNFIRTGIWHNHTWYLDRVTGAAGERLLRALEAFIHSAGRHGIHVQFTFYGMDPQTIQRRGETSVATGPGSNPYTDPVAIAAQKRWVLSIVRRFKDVPYLCWDLINEPSYSNPRHIFSGNYPNADPTEIAAWNRWLEKRYGTLAALAAAWNVAEDDLGGFGRIPLPERRDLDLQRSGNDRLVRAVDYNLFAQDMFNAWAREIIAAIRGAGARQLVAVGQDEGGVTNRVLNHFYADSGVDFTVNHSWWHDDALLFDSVAAKRPDKPNLIGETGPQPVWRMDRSWRYDELGGLGLYERKMALGFAAANSGSLHWAWERGDTFGIMRRDGSFKSWIDVQAGMGAFARAASPYAIGARKPEIAILLPQSLQLSAYNRMALAAQERCIRALFHHARTPAHAVGEYQVGLLGAPRLIVVPSPWALRREAWDALLEKARAGATVLLTGRFDLDEHFRPTGREKDLPFEYRAGDLITRENAVKWPGGDAVFSFPGDATTYLERGFLAGGATFAEAPIGKGRLLYFALPLELSSSEDALGHVYRFAAERAGVKPVYTTGVTDPGILIAPTVLENATLYVLTSESSSPTRVRFRDAASGREVEATLQPGRAALVLITRSGEIAARYGL